MLNRWYERSPLLKTIAVQGKLAFGDPFQDSGVVSRVEQTIFPISGKCWYEYGGANMEVATRWYWTSGFGASEEPNTCFRGYP